ncbi:MAG: hypothetical protein OEV00_13865, partial [Acidobacteriota bacterium]|nr:hypothetical protein [Acidobacteriota bacterium]
NEDKFLVDGLRSSVGTTINVSAVDRNLGTPYQDEFTFAFERELWAETSISVTYVNRAFKDQLQDIDVNHVPGDYGRCRQPSLLDNRTVQPLTALEAEALGLDPALAPGDGILDDCAGEIFFSNNSDDDDPVETDDPLSETTRLERPDGIPDLYLQNPGWGDIYVVGNFNSIDYDGVVLALTRRQYKSWEMQASYTYSRARGDGEDFQQLLGDDRSLLRDESGYQSYDQRHVVKLNATTITPWNFRLGGAISWESGLPYSLLSQQLSFDQVPPQYAGIGTANAARTRQRYLTGQRNDQRNEGFWNVDAKFTKEMQLARGVNMQVSAEVFNLLNDDTLEVNFAQINGNNIATQRFGRQWQVGIRMSF